MGVEYENRFKQAIRRHMPNTQYVVCKEKTIGDIEETEYYVYSKLDLVEIGGRSWQAARFKTRPMPGCCGVLLVYYLVPTKGREEVVPELVETIGIAAQAAGYGMLMFTQKLKSPLCGILEKADYLNTPFINGKTGNKLNVYLKVLAQKPKEPPKPRYDDEWDD